MTNDPTSRRPVIWFLVLVSILASMGYWTTFSNGGENRSQGLLVVQFAPMLAAFICSFWFRQNLRGFGWVWGKWRYQFIASVLPFIIALICFSLVWASGFGKLQPDSFIAEVQAGFSEMFGIEPLSAAATIILVIGINGTIGLLVGFASIGEELGWRGYLTPELMKSHSYTATSIIGGVIWAIYHYPLLIWLVAPHLGVSFWPLLVSILFASFALTFILNWLRLKSGSVWTSVIFHIALNIHIQGLFEKITEPTSELTHYISGQYGFMMAVVTVVFAFFFWSKRDQLQI